MDIMNPATPDANDALGEDRKQMTDDELKSIVEAQIYSSMGYVGGDLSQERAQALEYYLGEPFGNEVEGRSEVVSTDVADVIEWMLPALIRTFVSTDEAVRFDPVSAEDVEASQQETDYVNYVFYKQNPGFLILYTWVKDALLQKNGIIKTYWEKTKKETREEYMGLTDDQLMLLMQDPDLEPIEHTAEATTVQTPQGPVQQSTHNVVFKRIEHKGQVKIENVPPEHYLISKNYNSVDPSDAPFVAHRADKTVSELLEMGISQDTIDMLPDAQEPTTGEQVARQNLSDERNLYSSQSNTDKSMRYITVYECYIRVDYNGDGIAELRKVLKAGSEILSNEEVDSIPFDVLTPIILPHKHFGLSIADLIMDLQLIKSTIWRQMLDNMYLVNNGRNVVNENTVNLDDLLTSRPGGIVRVNGDIGNSVMPLMTQPLSQSAFQMVEYIDTVREGRSGVSQTTMGLNDALLNNNKGDASVSTVMSAAQQRVELIARVFAETGIKSLFLRIHELLLKHQDQAKIVQLRGKWIPVNPTEWRERTEMTINVGLGTTEQTQLVQALMMLLNTQKEAIANGGLNILVSLQNIYNSARDLSKAAGVRNVDQYFMDPSSPQAQQTMQNQQQQQDEAKQNDVTKQLVQVEHEKNQLAAQKAQMENQQQMISLQNERQKLEADFQQKSQDMERKMQERLDNIAVKLTELELKYKHNVPGSLV